MANVKKFSAAKVMLGGCKPLGEGCGLCAEDVQVKVSEERVKTNSGWNKDKPYVTECMAKIGSIACEECGLRQVGIIQDVEVEFELRRSTAEVYDSSVTPFQTVMSRLPSQLAQALFCQRDPNTADG